MALFPAFGKVPSGDALKGFSRSPNFRDGIFQNERPTPMSLEGINMLSLMWKFLNKPKETFPPGPLPALRTDLNALKAGSPTLVWFGHSSYLLRIQGVTILVDPVLCGHASPFSFMGRSFPGTDLYAPEDMPAIDILLLTHDHFDHLDYETIRRMHQRCKVICTSLGVGSHLKFWGVDPEKIRELDWWQELPLEGGLRLTAAPARHFSGRSMARFRTLWSSFILQGKDHTLYLGGDSGYDDHFKRIGEKYGPFNLALLECGQYNKAWPLIHMMPEETVQAAQDLNARWMMPVHWGKFSISLHPWDDPIRRASMEAGKKNLSLTTPRIGEPVILGESYPGDPWWLQVK